VFRFFLFAVCSLPLTAAVITYGDKDCLNQGCYGANEPTDGATLQGLSAGSVTLATNSFGHSFPFGPSADFPGTDQIFVGSVQTGTHDGYSVSAGRLNGPAVFTLDFSPLISSGQTLATLTLGIAADDIQFPSLGQPFIAKINGVVDPVLTNQLNVMDLGGPSVRFVSFGLNPAVDTGTHVLTVSIDQGGDGGDGFAVDFLTVGVTTSSVPEPATLLLAGLGLGLTALLRRHR